MFTMTYVAGHNHSRAGVHSGSELRSACVSEGAFDLAIHAGNPSLHLFVSPGGPGAAPTLVWSYPFEDAADRDMMIDRVRSGSLDLRFLGRLAMIFGGDELDRIASEIADEAQAARRRKREKAAEQARKFKIVELFRVDGKHRFHLELRRASSNDAVWKISYGRAIERDRLCDYMVWQRDRFPSFLDHVEDHGGEALSRLLLDEMFETERRVKKQGHGAGGMRPLRMWRGE